MATCLTVLHGYLEIAEIILLPYIVYPSASVLQIRPVRQTAKFNFVQYLQRELFYSFFGGQYVPLFTSIAAIVSLLLTSDRKSFPLNIVNDIHWQYLDHTTFTILTSVFSNCIYYIEWPVSNFNLLRNNPDMKTFCT